MNGLFSYKKRIATLSLVLLLCSCNHNESPTLLTQFCTLELNDSLNTICITNTHDFPVSFSMKINNQFPLDFENIKTTVREITKQEKVSNEQGAWEYVVKHTFHVKPFSHENWQHNPLLFLNSIGGGLCDDRASVLAKIWQELGDSARIIGLSGHIVPEVYANNKWQMYDPDEEIYFYDTNNIILSEKALEDNTDIFFSAVKNKTFNPIFETKNPNSLTYSQFYSTKENNRDETEWHLHFQPHSSDFILPSNSSLNISFDSTESVINISISLNTSSKGILQMPLVPFNTDGNFVCDIDSQTVNIIDSNYFFSKHRFIEKINIEKVNRPSVIRYLVNPKFHFMKAKNSVVLKSVDSLVVKTIHRTEKPKILFGKASLFFDNESRYHKAFLAQLAHENCAIIDFTFLRKHYIRFLDSDSTLSDKDRKVLLENFEPEFQKLYVDLPAQQQIVFWHSISVNYPKSAFYLYLALRHQKTDFLKQWLKFSSQAQQDLSVFI